MIKSLAYVGVKSPRYKEWETFGPKFLGAMLDEPGPDGAVRLRVDDQTWRIQVHPGEQDETAYFGWAVDYETDLDALSKKLADYGVQVTRGDADICAARSVNQMIFFEDPWGFRHEVTWARSHFMATFLPGRALSGFVTGAQGLGHVLLLLPDLDKAHEFFGGILGFEISDKIFFDNFGAHFYHVNARHHTLAIGRGPAGVRVFNHLMLQVQNMNDVGNAWDLVKKMDIPLVLSLGRHSNDQMFSFYVQTPAGFNIEYGFGGLEVTEPWSPRMYHENHIWGHEFQAAEGRMGNPGIVAPIAE